MPSAALMQRFSDSPEYLLALSLSASHRPPRRRTQAVTIEFNDEDATATVRREPEPVPRLRLLATKQTIAAAVLMYHVLMQRGPEYQSQLINEAVNFGRSAALRDGDTPPEATLNLQMPPDPRWTFGDYFVQMLDASPNDYVAASRKTVEAFEFLEAEGLAVDPAFIPELMVLLGLIPMHFSVRTPKGERIHREIRINAPLWYMDVSKGTKNGRPFTDFEFKFRGIEVVRSALTAMAKQYLDSEIDSRKARGKPVIRRNDPPSLDDPAE